MRILTRISHPACRSLIGRSIPLLDAVPEPAGVDGRTDERPGGERDPVLLLHDLMPRAAKQIEWLRRLSSRSPTMSIFLLLPPSGDALRELALHGSRLPLVGIEAWTQELTPETLAASLRIALNDRAEELRLWDRVIRWPLPRMLRFLAEAELRFAPRDASSEDVLRLAGITYESARREAKIAGLPGPGRFVEALRLLRVVARLYHGAKIKEVAPAYGFHDAERLARRMRHHFDITPTQARALGPAALLDRLERKWFGDVVAR